MRRTEDAKMPKFCSCFAEIYSDTDSLTLKPWQHCWGLGLFSEAQKVRSAFYLTIFVNAVSFKVLNQLEILTLLRK